MLAAWIPIGERLTNLVAVSDAGFGFSAVPPKVVGMGTISVTAYGRVAK